MARVRTRAKRSFYLLVALCVLGLLLELNRFLPGVWPGGGGGFRSSMNVSAGGPDSDRGSDVDPAPPDVSAVAPPEEPPAKWPPSEGVHVELRGPHGDLETRWRLGTGGGGRESLQPDSRGVVRAKAPALFTEGFRVRTNDGVLRHEHGLGEPAAKWVVQRPAGKLPRQRDAGRAGVHVLDAATGDPIEGATVTWRADGQRYEASSDATGEAVVQGERSGEPVRVEVTARNRETVTAWVSPRSALPVPVRLDELVTVTADVTLPAGRRPEKVTLSVLTTVRDYGFHEPVAKGAGEQARARVPRRALDGAWLEAIVSTAAGQFLARRPLQVPATSFTLPAWRKLRVRVVDADRRVVKRARVRAQYPADRASESEDVHPFPVLGQGLSGTGTHRLTVPADVPVRLLAHAPGMQPMVRVLTPVDGTDVLEFVVEPGIEIPVLVSDADGRPLRGARIVARTSLEGIRVVRKGETDAKGRASVGAFGPGPVEVFVVADGHACAAALANAKAGMATLKVELQRGYPLTLIVEDPFGVPLEDVEVTVTPADGGLPLVSEPDAGEWRTDADGRLRIEHLPNRIYVVGLSLPGHKPVKLRKVQPGAVTYFATLLRD